MPTSFIRMEKVALTLDQMKMKLVSGINKSGFTFVELLVVIMVLGIIATIVVPRLGRRVPLHARQEFQASLNGLAQAAWQQAIQTQKVHRVHFDFEKRVAQIQVGDKKDAKGETNFGPAPMPYQKNYYQWPDNFTFTKFAIDGVEEMTRGKRVDKIWFYIVPDGMAQEVVIEVVDADDQRDDGKDVRFGMALNPFTAQFKTI